MHTHMQTYTCTHEYAEKHSLLKTDSDLVSVAFFHTQQLNSSSSIKRNLGHKKVTALPELSCVCVTKQTKQKTQKKKPRYIRKIHVVKHFCGPYQRPSWGRGKTEGQSELQQDRP